MRKTTIASIFLITLGVPYYFSRAIADFFGVPATAYNNYRVIVGSGGVIFAIFVLAVLTLLNPRLLAWRKSKGRDIEEEERFESDHGMISLTRKDDD